MRDVTVQGVKMSSQAAGNLEMIPVDVAADVARLRADPSQREALLAECLAGVEGEDAPDSKDIIEGWRDYVAAVAAAAEEAA